jgi:hypothetical protein
MMEGIMQGMLKRLLPQVAKSMASVEVGPGEKSAILLAPDGNGGLIFQNIVLKAGTVENVGPRAYIDRIDATGSPEELLKGKP